MFIKYVIEEKIIIFKRKKDKIIQDIEKFKFPKLTELYDDIIVKKERQIIEALKTLDYYNNTDIASRLDSGPLGEEDQAELESYLSSSAFANILPSSQEKK